MHGHGGTLNLLNCTVHQNTGKGGGGISWHPRPACMSIPPSSLGITIPPEAGGRFQDPAAAITNSGANLIGSNESSPRISASPPPAFPRSALRGHRRRPAGSQAHPSRPLRRAGADHAPARSAPRPSMPRGPPIPAARTPGVSRALKMATRSSSGSQLGIGAVEAGRHFPVNQSRIRVATRPATRMPIAAIPVNPLPHRFRARRFRPPPHLPQRLQLNITATRRDTIFIDASNLSGSVTISGNNQAASSNPRHRHRGHALVEDCEWECDMALKAAAASVNFGTCTVINSILSGNLAALAQAVASSNDGTCTVHSSTLSDNTAPFVGGGILNSGTCTVLSSTLSGNSAASAAAASTKAPAPCSPPPSAENIATAGRRHPQLATAPCTPPPSARTPVLAAAASTTPASFTSPLASSPEIPAAKSRTASPQHQQPHHRRSPPFPPSATTAAPRRPCRRCPAARPSMPQGRFPKCSRLPSVPCRPCLFTLTFNGATTVSLNQFLTASEVATALQNLSTIGSGNVTVEKTNNEVNDTFFKITFVGARGGLNQSQLISSNISAQVTTVQNGSPGSPLTTDQRGIRRPRDGDGNGSALPDLGAVEAGLASSRLWPMPAPAPSAPPSPKSPPSPARIPSSSLPPSAAGPSPSPTSSMLPTPRPSPSMPPRCPPD